MQFTNRTQSRGDDRKLDLERAASMADEGGVSGAIADAREQSHAQDPRSLAPRARWGAKKLWGLAALGAGAWLILIGLRRR